MGRFSSSMLMRSRPDRARRRVVFSAESLESRQLLSVAAFQPTIAPAAIVPAAIGPVAPAANTEAGMGASSVGSAPIAEFTLQINPAINGQVSPHGFIETIFVFAQPISSGIGAASTTTTMGPAASAAGAANPGTSMSASTPAITPLTAIILAGPNGGKGKAIIVVVMPQPVVANFSSSTIPVTTQAILATATLEEQPIQPPVLGQGFESGQTQGNDLQENRLFKAPATPAPLEPRIPAIDYVEPVRPAPDQPPAAQPGQLDQAPAPPAPDAPPVEVISMETPIRADSDDAPDFPILSPRAETRTEAEAPAWSMAAVVGTAAIAGGGYHLVLGGANRFNQRWIPARKSPRRSRRRNSEDE